VAITEHVVDIVTERLLLREFVRSDWRAVHQYASDPEVVRYLTWGPNTEKETRAFIRSILRARRRGGRAGYDLAVVLRSEDRLIGGCAIHPATWIGYVFNRACWGRGYATEAARALLALGFDGLGLHRVTATCDPQNLASARVLEKSGMQLEGRLREHVWQRDRWRDSLLYAILEDDWRAAGR
jgi:ribosomal-protein-alanine N-acetyltransferase